MKVRNRLAKPHEVNITCHGPFTESELIERDKDYQALSDEEFQRKYRRYLYTPAVLETSNGRFEIQMNFCNNPFCGWYGLQQKRYEDIKSKPSRYKLASPNQRNDDIDSRIQCNDIPALNSPKPILENLTTLISNWSLSEEIRRLVVINTVVPDNHEYCFHKQGCTHADKTPFNSADSFRKKGTSKSKSKIVQCTVCGKCTHILPKQEENFNYKQKRNDILPQLSKLLFGRMPITKICDFFDIGASTFYSKVELLYKRCLEFNAKYEAKPISEKQFSSIWINTDCMIYNLNTVRNKGRGGDAHKESAEKKLDKKLQTYIICSADMDSGYTFRCDVAYDSTVSLEHIEADTVAYHCDHSYEFLRKNDRLTYSLCPQPPTANDSQTYIEYKAQLDRFNRRKNYVAGCHVKTQYTALAHYILLAEQLNAYRWNFVSDDDSTLESCIFKVFADKFRSEDAMYFTCQYDKTLSLEEAGFKAKQSRRDLIGWATARNLDIDRMYAIAKAKLSEELTNHEFYSHKEVRGVKHPVRGNNPIEHPLPDKDEGTRYVNLISPISFIDNNEMAGLIMRVSNRTINNFFQEVRRSVSILERPLMTARGDGKSYIYANYNPKYAQQILTIFRTFYNFCWPRRGRDGLLTPAQRLGITDKVFDPKDVIYLK